MGSQRAGHDLNAWAQHTEKGATRSIAGVKTGVATMENSMEALQKIKIRFAIWSCSSTSRQISEIKKLKMLHALQGSLFMTVKTQKQSACPLADGWTEKMLYVYTVEYYSTIKRNGILPFAASWMDLEDIALSEIGQTEEDKCCMISLHVVSKKYNMLVNTT